MPRRSDLQRILLLVPGRLSSVRPASLTTPALRPAKPWRDEGFEVVLVNSNPATIMTDPNMADRTYIEPLTPEVVAQVIAAEAP